MGQAKCQPDAEPAPAPVGFVEPSDERARRVWSALNDHRLDDAQRHLDDTAETGQGDTSWHDFLEGLLCARRQELTAARIAWERLVATTDAGADGQRLRAMAWERLGWLHRRREELGRAIELHQQAFELRAVAGSPLEQWESAQSCAVTSVLRERHDEAIRWFDRAMAIGGAVADERQSYRCRAVTSAAYADLLTNTAPGEASVQTARHALTLWQRYDLGSVDAARAQAHLGRALVRHAEHVLETAPESALAALEQAIENLNAAKEALLAFGPVARADTLRCGDLLDFALRLRTAV